MTLSLTLSVFGRSREGAWIEIALSASMSKALDVAPARERGLKYGIAQHLYVCIGGRSRKGAWIEIRTWSAPIKAIFVAPARECGLKFTVRLALFAL